MQTSCELNGEVILNGEEVTFYSTSTVPFGDICSSEIRSCIAGTLSGTYEFTTCEELDASSCELNGQEISHGENVTAYSSATVPFGCTCTSEIRSCADGNLSGSFTFSACEELAAVSCELNGQEIYHGENVTAYSSATVPFGDICSSEMRSCSDGNLSGSFTFSACESWPPPVVN